MTKRFLMILVLGLLLSSNAYAKEIKVYHKDENSISVTAFIFNNEKQEVIAAKHCAQYKKFVFVFTYSRKQGALNEKGKPTRLYHCSRSNLKKSPLTGKGIYWTNYDENHEFAKEEGLEMFKKLSDTGETQEAKKFEKLEGYKATCEALGFKPESEKFADCALKLFVADNKESQVVQSSSGTQEIIIRDPDREQRIRLKKFNDRLSGKCAWTDWDC